MLLTIFNLILTIFYIVFLLNRLIYYRRLDCFTMVIAIFIICYAIHPLFMYILKDVQNYSFIQSRINFDTDGILNLLYSTFLTIIGFISLLIGYSGRTLSSKGLLSTDDLEAIKMNHDKIEWQYNVRNTILTAWICLAIGCVSLFLWAHAYGSIWNLIVIANKVRSSAGGVSNSLAFFKRPAAIVQVCALIFFATFIKETAFNLRKISALVGFILASGATYLYLLANDGRLTIVLFLIGLIWIAIGQREIKHIGRYMILLILIFITGFILLANMDNITSFLRYGNWNSESKTNILSSFLSELSFITVGNQTAILNRFNGKVGFTIIDDIMTGVCAWLPSSLKIGSFQDVWNINTNLYYGNSSIPHGQSPCGFIAQGYYDLGIVGVILIGFLIGYMVKKFQYIWLSAKLNVFWLGISGALIASFIRLIPYCSMYDFILGLFPIAVTVGVYWLCNQVVGEDGHEVYE